MIDFEAPAEDYDSRPCDSEAGAAMAPQPSRPRPSSPRWLASEVCAEAAHLVAGDRGRVHGDKITNFRNIARIWNAILAAKCAKAGLPPLIALDAHDVANMMEAMKIARRYTGTANVDDYVDGAGYAGVAAEVFVETAG
jgi:hypothetical protein